MQGAARESALEIRAAKRNELSRPVVGEILAWVADLRQPPGNALRKAVEYMTGRWAGLTRFLDDPRVPLDNNLVERQIRPLALGRKNFTGTHSVRGAQAAATLYSLIATCQLCGVDPRTYLLAAVRAALEKPRRVLLPHDLKR